jgi:hypothetical protein
VYVSADSSFPTKGETCNYWVGRIDERTNAFISRPVQVTHNRGFCIVDTSATVDSKRLVFTKRSDEVPYLLLMSKRAACGLLLLDI